MLGQNRWKLLGVLIVASALLGAVGWQQFAPRPTLPVTITVTPAVTKVTGSQTIVVPSSTGSIQPGQIKPISFYLSLLESNGTQPYVQLARELRKLPDLTNTTAVAKITYLALNATNQEVKEAFELMIKGGTPNPSDFKYKVPDWNTELQVLYWLACQNELRTEDTLSLAIAMTNGLWITLGDSPVVEAVRNDTTQLLRQFREVNVLRGKIGWPLLEEYPLEAKIALAWTAGDTGTHGPHAITGPQTKRDCKTARLDLAGYRWDNVSPETLRQMRDHMRQKEWTAKDTDQTVTNIEEYFYFSGNKQHYRYVSSWDEKVQVEGETVSARNMNNANFNFRYYLEHGYAIGVCEDEMTLVSAFLKSWGIATLPQLGYWKEGNWYNGHTYTMYFDPASRSWKCYALQIGIVYFDARDGYIFLPPIIQNTYIPRDRDPPKFAAVPYPYQSGEVNKGMLYPLLNITGSNLSSFIRGVDSKQIKQWVIYGEKFDIVSITYRRRAPVVSWTTTSDGPGDLIDENGKTMGDLGQAYVDITSFSYGCVNESVYFRFTLNDKIPNQFMAASVGGIWYQVLLDVDFNPNTGYQMRSDFTPDFMLEFSIVFSTETRTVRPIFHVLRYSGSGKDWSWTPIGSTTGFGIDAVIEGGVGYSFFVVACKYQDISVSRGSTVRFYARSGIRYEGKVYNDIVPDKDTLTLIL